MLRRAFHASSSKDFCVMTRQYHTLFCKVQSLLSSCPGQLRRAGVKRFLKLTRQRFLDLPSESPSSIKVLSYSRLKPYSGTACVCINGNYRKCAVTLRTRPVSASAQCDVTKSDASFLISQFITYFEVLMLRAMSYLPVRTPEEVRK